jgi:hypothetical protein
MKAKTMLIVLMTVALIGANVAVGYAGGGGSGGPGGSIFFQCYNAEQGANPPHVLEVNDQFIDLTVEKVGKLKMICSFNPTVTQVVGSPGDINVVQVFDSITCYDAPGAHAKAVVSYTDNFFGDPQTVKVQGPSQLICVPACSNPAGC